MDVPWITTPSGAWLCYANVYTGVVLEVEGSWTARIENDDIIYPANVTFQERATAQAWVKEQFTALLEEPPPSR